MKAVAFCNLNAWDQNFARPIIEKYVNDGTVNISNYESLLDYTRDLNDYYRANLIREYLNNTDFLGRALGFDIDATLISCYFDGEKCTKDDFEPYYDYYYGMCYR